MTSSMFATTRTALACCLAALTLTACPNGSQQADLSPGDQGGTFGDILPLDPVDLRKPADLTDVPVDTDLPTVEQDMTAEPDLFGVETDMVVVAEPDMTSEPDLNGEPPPDMTPGPVDMLPQMDDPPVLTGTLYWVEIEDGTGNYLIRRKDLPSEVPVTVLGGIVANSGVDVSIAARGSSVVFLVDGAFRLISNADVAVDGGGIDPVVTDVFTCPAPNDFSSCANPMLGNDVLIYRLSETDDGGDPVNFSFFQVAMSGTQTPTKIPGLADLDLGRDTFSAQITDDGTKILINQFPFDFTSPSPIAILATIGGTAATLDYSVDDIQVFALHQGGINEVLRFTDLPLGTGDSTLGRLTFGLTSNGPDYGVFPLAGPNPVQMRARDGAVIMISSDNFKVQAFSLSSVFPTMTPVDLTDVQPLNNFEWVP